MKLHELKPNEKAKNTPKKRLGRGDATGKGRSATRGTKGAKSRSGYKKKIGFEGGQMPLQKRVPKFGFHNINQKSYRVFNLDRLQSLVDNKKISDSIDFETLRKLGEVQKNDLVKILGQGELKASLNVSAHKFSASAKKAIEEAGGKTITL